MRVFVTGGAGFIGSHVCERLLTAGHEVWVLDDLNPFYDVSIKRANLAALERTGGSVTVLIGDITESAVVDDVFAQSSFDQVVHLAARAGVRPSLEEPALYQRVNVEGTTNILEAARRHGVPKIVLASSSSVYGTDAEVPFSEDALLSSPVSPYAASKIATEALAHVWHDLYGMDLAVLRFFTVYGPRQRPDLAIHKFARLMSEGRPIPVFGDGSTARDYTHIDDIVDGIMGAMSRELGYEIINLGGSQTTTLSRLIQLLEDAMGARAIIDRQDAQPGDVPRTWANVSKAKELLGFEPTISIEQGIPTFVDWFRRRRR
jgi:UDP-glucuronate 4-epimerase